MTDRFRPDAALRGITPPVDRGLNRRGDRLVIDDPHAASDAIKRAVADAIKDGAVGGIREAVNRHLDPLFEDRGPIGHKGRSSIPRSHRGEGFNYVD